MVILSSYRYRGVIKNNKELYLKQGHVSRAQALHVAPHWEEQTN